jgi:hypothetical protein
MTPGKNVIAGVNDATDKLFTGVNDTVDKLFISFNNTAENFSLIINCIDDRDMFFLQIGTNR